MTKSFTLLRLAGAIFCVAGLAGVAMIGQEAPAPGSQMATAADDFLASLSPELRKTGTFEFDDQERTGWYFTPQQKARTFTRKGIRFEELNEEQRKKALALLKTGTSASGYEQATTIMSLEGVLRDAEGNKGAMVRNPDWYFISFFGKPSKTGKWGWRFEGHHLSINFTVDRGEVQSPTPFLFAASPADVKNGPRKGLRTLPEVEDLARQLIKSLDEKQSAVANKGAKHFPEVDEGTRAPKKEDPVGLKSSEMTSAQKDTLWKLIEAYTNRMPNKVSAEELKTIKEKGIDQIYFAYTGSSEPGKGYTYRIQGPTFLAQFLNIQADGYGNPNNHIHSVWRRLPGDFDLKN
jgi:hypothetical protein